MSYPQLNKLAGMILYIDMKELTIKEVASMGGKARAKKLSSKRRKEIASNAGKKGGRPSKNLTKIDK